MNPFNCFVTYNQVITLKSKIHLFIKDVYHTYSSNLVISKLVILTTHKHCVGYDCCSMVSKNATNRYLNFTIHYFPFWTIIATICWIFYKMCWRLLSKIEV